MNKGFPYNKTHDESHTRLHNIWCSINCRCNPNNKQSERYGKRGIKRCEEWNDYTVFAKWARENGYQDDLTIERIDVNGDYCPENCTWIPLAKQARNRRTTHWVEYKGQKMSLAEACEIAGLPYKQVFFRMRHSGWSFEKAITTPIGAELHQKPFEHKCAICGKEFISKSPRSKFCSISCFREAKNKKRRRTHIKYLQNHVT